MQLLRTATRKERQRLRRSGRIPRVTPSSAQFLYRLATNGPQRLVRTHLRVNERSHTSSIGSLRETSGFNILDDLAASTRRSRHCDRLAMKAWPRTDTDSREMLLECLQLRGLKVHAAPNGVTPHAAIEATRQFDRARSNSQRPHREKNHCHSSITGRSTRRHSRTSTGRSGGLPGRRDGCGRGEIRSS
jgi:hypothetical protein